MEDALSLAVVICKGGPLAIRLAKRAIDDGYGLQMDEALAIESRCYEGTLETEDRLEGLRAFREKQDPIFKGK